MKLQEILRTLPSLPAADLKAIRTRVDFCLQSPATNSRPISSDWLTPVICDKMEEMRKFVRCDERPRNVRKDYDEVVKYAQKFLLDGVDRDLNGVERRALAKLAIDALVDYVQDWDGFGPSLVMNSVVHIPEALDRALPGYYEAGMLGLTLRRRKRIA